jgi:hypothetical protein
MKLEFSLCYMCLIKTCGYVVVISSGRVLPLCERCIKSIKNHGYPSGWRSMTEDEEVIFSVHNS